MIQVDLRSRTPIYEQLFENVRRMILEGQLEEDDKMPSVRELAALLTINPNTIQKAYKALEREGYLYSVSGKGNFVKGLGGQVLSQEKRLVLTKVEDAASEARLLKVPKEEILALVGKVYSEEDRT